ncbi:His_Phos_1 domain-containing protein [Cephalotus follicularis]|uniref:His_Phos_1 domain-containing protein n=1 Tax=Cephalotus follicularis TaxID=3775 RepID=A0A1Q3BVH4_CEPFO|nr:His_Phos_1 domain-containing protein [Cephalotus follicularis]
MMRSKVIAGPIQVIKGQQLTGMDTSTARVWHPRNRRKILHLVRHAQGFHNIEQEKGGISQLSPKLFDAQLSPLGWQQTGGLHKLVHASGLLKKIELVVTSPMSRTMQTTIGVFGSEGHTDGLDVTPVIVTTAGNNGHCGISTPNCPPIIAVELCRERLGIHPCDKRRSISEYRSLFPAIDFSLIESDDDNQWKADTRETHEDVAARGMEFMEWLWTRQEKEIAVVSHGVFLQQTLITLGNDCDPSVKIELGKRFDNCEMRSLVIVDESKMESE